MVIRMPGSALACAGLALLALAPKAWAGAYAIVRSQPDTITVMDPAGVEPVPGNDRLRQAWSVSVQRNLVSGGAPQPGYVRTLSQYDCAGRTVRWKSFAAFSRFGAPLMSQENKDDGWKPVAANSEEDAAIRLVCDRQNRWAAVSAQSLSQLVLSLMQAWDPQPAAPPDPAPPPAAVKGPAKSKSRRPGP